MRIWLCCLANGVAIILCKFSVIPMWIICYYFKSLEQIWEQRSMWTVCCVLVALPMSAATAWMVLSPDPAAGNARCWTGCSSYCKVPISRKLKSGGIAGDWTHALQSRMWNFVKIDLFLFERQVYRERRRERNLPFISSFPRWLWAPELGWSKSRSQELRAPYWKVFFAAFAGHQQAAGSEVQQPGPGLGILWNASDAERVLACCCAGSKNVEF